MVGCGGNPVIGTVAVIDVGMDVIVTVNVGTNVKVSDGTMVLVGIGVTIGAQEVNTMTKNAIFIALISSISQLS
jgi:hypothetical protein